MPQLSSKVTLSAPGIQSSRVDTPLQLTSKAKRSKATQLRAAETPDPEVLATSLKDGLRLTATVPGKLYLLVVPPAEKPSLSGATVRLTHGARIYELRLVSEHLVTDRPSGLKRVKAGSIPVIPPPPSLTASLTAVSAWVWCPK